MFEELPNMVLVLEPAQINSKFHQWSYIWYFVNGITKVVARNVQACNSISIWLWRILGWHICVDTWYVVLHLLQSSSCRNTQFSYLQARIVVRLCSLNPNRTVHRHVSMQIPNWYKKKGLTYIVLQTNKLYILTRHHFGLCVLTCSLLFALVPVITSIIDRWNKLSTFISWLQIFC